MKKTLILLFFYCATLVAQNDTIYLKDTIISSVRILNHNNKELIYFYIDSNEKKIEKISLKEVEKTIYENKKIEVYCDLISTKKFLGTEEKITIDYGNRDSLWVSESIYTLYLKDLKRYNSIIDALNYMGNEGWETIGSYSTSHKSYLVEHYILKKKIIKEEIK